MEKREVGDNEEEEEKSTLSLTAIAVSNAVLGR